MIEEILTNLGLQEGETKVYLRLLEVGQQSAGSLARDVGLPRATLYGILVRLQETGLVGESNRELVKVFTAEPPEKIQLLLEEQRGRIEEQQSLLTKLMPALRQSGRAKLLKPTFRLYEGRTELTQMMKDMLLYSNLETLAFWPIQTTIEVIEPGFFRSMNKVRLRNNLSIRAIWPRSQVVSLKDYPYLGSRPELLRELRIAPEGVDASMGYWTYGTKVIFLSSEQENIGFVIESAEMVELLTVHFEVLWNLSTPIPDDPDPDALRAFLAEVET